MKEITVYIRVPVEQEPDEGDYITDVGICHWDTEIKSWYSDYTAPSFYLKEISLTEYMVGFAEWLEKREIYFDRGFYFQGSHCDDPPLDPVKLFKRYLKEKGGIILQ